MRFFFIQYRIYISYQNSDNFLNTPKLKLNNGRKEKMKKGVGRFEVEEEDLLGRLWSLAFD